jgi:hypothetical protein
MIATYYLTSILLLIAVISFILYFTLHPILKSASPPSLTRSTTTFNLSIDVKFPQTQNDYIAGLSSCSNSDNYEHTLGNGWTLREISP